MRSTLCTWFVVVSTSAWADHPVWLELAPGGHVLARAVVEASCPTIEVDRKTSAMTPRSASDAASAGAPPASHRLVCEKDVTGATAVAVAGTILKMPVKSPKRIVVIGDTGCRIKVQSGAADSDDDDAGATEKVQDCNDPSQWPFAAVAASAALEKPDLIIHVGDYLYRESKCPVEHSADCGSSPSGDNWATWDADFFAPAQRLLRAAPWIFVRGNHEICERAGKGWFYYLHAGAYGKDNQCDPSVAPFQIHLGDFDAWVIDSSGAADADPPPDQVAAFTSQFKEAAAKHPSHAWLLSHRPIWAAKAGEKGDRDHLRTLNATLEEAWKAAPIPGIDLVIAGHTHLFELLSFGKPLPVQAVVGNGGTDLAHKIKPPLTGQIIGGSKVSDGTCVDAFGYVLIEPARNREGWSLHLHDSAGRKQLACAIADGTTRCGAN